MLNSERMTVALENAHLQELAKQSDVTHIQITLKQPGRKPDTWRDVKISISLEDNGTNPPNIKINASDAVLITPQFSNQFSFLVK